MVFGAVSLASVNCYHECYHRCCHEQRSNTMNKISFFLARPNDPNPSVVQAYMRVGGGQLKIGTGIRVRPKQWNKKAQRVKGSATGAAPINDRLERITVDLTTIVLEMQTEGIEPTPERVRSRFDALTTKDAARAGEKSFLDYFDDWYHETDGKVAQSTRGVYRSTLRHLTAYSEARGHTLTFEGMDRTFVNAFTRYLSTVAQLQDVTIEKYRKTWKTFMRWAVDRGLTTNDYFASVPKLKPAEKTPNRLLHDELDRLSRVDVSDEPTLENARDLFVLQCWTGLRYSDLCRLVDDPSAYRRGDVVHISTQKTGRAVGIPLLPEALRILDGANPPHSITNQRMNEYLKDAARRAGLDRPIRQTEERGKKRSETTDFLHDVIRTHDAKRTFISLALERGISRETVRAITGNTDRTLNRYIKLDEVTVREEFLRAFNQQ